MFVSSLIYLVSKVNSTVTLPDGSSGVNVVSERISFSSINRGSPVALSIRAPLTVYSLSGTRCLYSTTSSRVNTSVAPTSFLPSMVAVVPSSGVLSFLTVISITSSSSETVA